MSRRRPPMALVLPAGTAAVVAIAIALALVVVGGKPDRTAQQTTAAGLSDADRKRLETALPPKIQRYFSRR